MSYRGIDIREDSDRILFRSFFQDSLGIIVPSGTAQLYLYRLHSDGSLYSYDFNDGSFKTGALTTETVNLTQRKGNNSTRDTGIWTYNLAPPSGFHSGNIYFAQVYHSGASPTIQTREFQYGSGIIADILYISGVDVKSSNGYIKVSEGTGIGQLDLTSGRIGIDWAKISNPSASVNLSNTDFSGASIYFAQIKFVKDGTNNTDEYAAIWYRDNIPLNSGQISNPAISVYNIFGTALFENRTMNYASSNLGIVSYIDTGFSTVSGQPYIAHVSGLINSQTREWRQLIGLDLY